MNPLRMVLVGEVIKAQTDGFGEKLEAVVKVACDFVRGKPQTEMNFGDKNPLIVAIQDQLYSRLKIKTRIITNKGLAAILPLYSNRTHIFLHEYFRGDIDIREQTKFLNNLKSPRGTVDIQKAQLGGFFSEYEHTVYLNIWALVNQFNMTPGQITGCLLHEIGHGFKACYFADRCDRTNQVLATLARENNGEEKPKLDYVYTELKKINPQIEKQEVDRLVNGGKVIGSIAWVKIIVGTVRNLTVNDTYNDTSFEAEADSFASRFGYGREIVEALDILAKGSAERSNAAYAFFLLNELLVVVAFFLAIGLVATAGVIGPLFSMTVVLMASIFGSRADVKDMTYDELKDRYKRMRNDMILQLKDKDLPRDYVKSTVNDIAVIDESINNTRKVRGIFTTIAWLLSAGSRAASRSISDQQIYETLAANDLYLESAKLQAMA